MKHKNQEQEQEPITNIGIKIGSLNTAIVYRNDTSIEPSKTVDKTCIRYPSSFLKKSTDLPVVGEKATKYKDSFYPLRLGVVETEEGVKQTADILRYMIMPVSGRIVLASPAVQMKAGNDRLARAIKQVCRPYNDILAYSEGLCSAVCIKGVQTIRETTFFSLNLGSTTLEVGAFNEGNQIHLSAHPEVCGNRVDAKIYTMVSNTVGDALITENELREKKEQASITNPKPVMIKAMTKDGVVEAEILDEVIKPIEDYARKVAGIFCDEVFGTVDTTTRNRAIESPLYISGGMGNIEGVPELIISTIEEKMNIKFTLATTPERNGHVAPAIGALMLAEAIANETAEGS